jgi:glycine cleavage system H lipoate-binding protein
VHAVVLPVGFQDVDGFKLPQGYYLHPGHAWARIEDGDEVRIGIDDFAQKLFGPFDHIESPLVGKEVTAGTPAIVVRHGNRSARILSPVNGVVTSINTDLRNNGVSSVDDPYTAGWVMRVRADTPRQDIAAMLIGPEAGAWIKTEVKRLYRIIEEDAGPLAADGGFLSNDIMSRLPALDWDRMAGLFLKT